MGSANLLPASMCRNWNATLGVELLDRSTRPLVVTQAGRLYAEFCRDILHRKDDFEVALQRLKQEVEGTLRVASIYSVGLSEMVEIEKEFARRQPEAKLEVEYLRPERIYEAVLAGEADLGLISYPEARRDITVIPWRREEMVLAVAPSSSAGPEGRGDRSRGVEWRGLYQLRRRSSHPAAYGPVS